MPDWNDLLNEIKATGSTYDNIRRKYLKKLSKTTGRNVIVYYSGWLQKPGIEIIGVSHSLVGIEDNDKIGFMTTIHKLDRSKGLDLVLHTPGGEMAVTESIVDYLRSMFNNDIRAIVPQIAMSGGTMIACACKCIIMGSQSSLGPIDPQIMGLPAHGILEEFEEAKKECLGDPSKIPLWQPIIARYSPTLIGECKKAIDWAEEMVKIWLSSGMLKEKENADELINSIIKELGSHALTKSHSRHLSAKKCKDMGLNIEFMEDNQLLQEAILSVHHACIHTLTHTAAIKIIENQNGKALIRSVSLPKQ
jgi:hypothetical protein